VTPLIEAAAIFAADNAPRTFWLGGRKGIDAIVAYAIKPLGNELRIRSVALAELIAFDQPRSQILVPDLERKFRQPFDRALGAL
jgi:hypothetical protein